MMTRRLALVLAGAFSLSLLAAAMPAPTEAVCRPYCLDLNKNKGGAVRGLDRADAMAGEHGDRGKHHHYGWAKHLFHKGHKHGSHRGHGGHNEPPVTQPPVTQPPVTPPPPPGPTPCIGC